MAGTPPSIIKKINSGSGANPQSAMFDFDL
jgi:hypothetical protein